MLFDEEEKITAFIKILKTNQHCSIVKRPELFEILDVNLPKMKKILKPFSGHKKTSFKKATRFTAMHGLGIIIMTKK